MTDHRLVVFSKMVLLALPEAHVLHLVQLDDGSGTMTEGLEAVEYEHALETASPTTE